MADLSGEIKIVSPEQLTQLLQQIRAAVLTGTLRQCEVNSDVEMALSEVPDSGPWPDVLDMHFEDSSGRRYTLSVDTYHGGGGTWEPS